MRDGLTCWWPQELLSFADRRGALERRQRKRCFHFMLLFFQPQLCAAPTNGNSSPGLTLNNELDHLRVTAKGVGHATAVHALVVLYNVTNDEDGLDTRGCDQGLHGVATPRFSAVHDVFAVLGPLDRDRPVAVSRAGQFDMIFIQRSVETRLVHFDGRWNFDSDVDNRVEGLSDTIGHMAEISSNVASMSLRNYQRPLRTHLNLLAGG